MRLSTHRRIAAALLAACACAAFPAGAGAVTASETITAGSLAFINSTPANITFPGVSLNGTSSQSVTQTQAFDVNDSTGSGNGWKITATSTTFQVGASGVTLPTGATQILTAPSDTCDSSVSCTTATNGISYPYTLPAAATAPTASILYNAAAGTGMAAQTITPTWTLTVPASAKAGTYGSTWTLTLASAPS